MREGICDRCRCRRMVNRAISGGAVVGEFCDDCYDWPALVARHSMPATPDDDGGPGFHNVVRALEEDR